MPGAPLILRSLHYTLACAFPLMDGGTAFNEATTPSTMSSMNVKSRDNSDSLGPCKDEQKGMDSKYKGTRLSRADTIHSSHPLAAVKFSGPAWGTLCVAYLSC